MNTLKKLILPTILCIIGIFSVYSVYVQQNLSDNLLRMHIIANSNSDTDQIIKLAVRDNILSQMSENISLSQINDIARKTLWENSFDYSAKTSIERCFVPEKEYKNIHMPEGMYTCLKVVLGDGNGENWWCVAYPPLCFTEEVFGDLSDEGRENLKKLLNDEAFYSIIKSENINFRFKIVEDFQKLKKYL